VLEQYGLLPIVFGDEVKPAPLIVTDANGVSTNNNEEIKAWCQKNNAARNGIKPEMAPLELDRQRSLINCKTANEMWKKDYPVNTSKLPKKTSIHSFSDSTSTSMIKTRV
jgi:hypothetical protein